VAKDLPTDHPLLVDEARIVDISITEDYSGVAVELVEISGCRLYGTHLTSSRLQSVHLVDSVVVASDFSGAVLDDCSIRRVEFRGCRFSGIQAQHSRFEDVGFFDCKIDGANFRMTKWKSAEFRECDLTDADFYGATLPGSRFEKCDLSGLQISSADLTGSRLHASTLERIQGPQGLRGVVIGSDQVLPVALAVFGTLGIVVDDEVR